MSSLILSPTGPPADAKPCRQAGGMGTLPTPQVSARVCLEAQGTVTCWDAAARDRKASCLHEQQVLAHSPSTSPTPLSKTTLATKAWGQPLPRDPTTRTRGATDKSWLYSRTQGQLCHWQLPSYCTSSDGGISMPRHNTASALWDLGGGAGTVTTQQAGERAGAPRVHKGKRPVHP